MRDTAASPATSLPQLKLGQLLLGSNRRMDVIDRPKKAS